MSATWASPTTVVHGIDVLEGWVRDHPQVVLLIDHAVQESSVAARITEAAGSRPVLVEPVHRPPTWDRLTELEARLSRVRNPTPPAVVALGGGSTMDLAVLLATMHRQPRAGAMIAARQRSGLVLLPQSLRRSLPVAVIPSTVGTGAELSSSACVTTADGQRRLVVGEALRPDLAAVDPDASAALPAELVAEGAFEALFRLTAMLIGDHRDRPVEDPLVVTMCRSLIDTGDAVAAARTSGEVAGDLRMTVAKLSGLSQGGWLMTGRNRYAAKGWYLANELSTVLGCRKVSALARVLPALWSTVADGDSVWGDDRRLAATWNEINRSYRERPPAVGDGRLPADPVQGVRTLLDRWRIEPCKPPAADQIPEVSRRVIRAWGAGLPMLYGIRSHHVQALLHRAAPETATERIQRRPEPGPGHPVRLPTTGATFGTGELADLPVPVPSTQTSGKEETG